MTHPTPSDPTDARFQRLAVICLALPEVVSDGDRHTRFSVRGRTFAYHLVDHHGDGRVALCCKVPADENALLVKADPQRFFLPPYIGPKGWVGLDLDAGEVDWEEIRSLVTESYRLVAPRSLAAIVSI